MSEMTRPLAQRNLPQPWVKPATFAMIGLLAWLSVFLLATVAAGHYRCFKLPASGVEE